MNYYIITIYSMANGVYIISIPGLSHKTFEHEFVLILELTANQQTALIYSFVLIGQFWSYSYLNK